LQLFICVGCFLVLRPQVLGGGIDIVTIGRGTYIRSVPGEFNTDKNKVMELAQAAGYISAGESKEHTKDGL
jgi:hypothetical protein